MWGSCIKIICSNITAAALGFKGGATASGLDRSRLYTVVSAERPAGSIKHRESLVKACVVSETGERVVVLTPAGLC